MAFLIPEFFLRAPSSAPYDASGWKTQPVSYEESDVRKNALLMYGYIAPLALAIWNAYTAGALLTSFLLTCTAIGWNELT